MGKVPQTDWSAFNIEQPVTSYATDAVSLITASDCRHWIYQLWHGDGALTNLPCYGSWLMGTVHQDCWKSSRKCARTGAITTWHVLWISKSLWPTPVFCLALSSYHLALSGITFHFMSSSVPGWLCFLSICLCSMNTTVLSLVYLPSNCSWPVFFCFFCFFVFFVFSFCFFFFLLFLLCSCCVLPLCLFSSLRGKSLD